MLVCAYDAVVAKDAVAGTKVMLSAALAVVAYEEDIASLAQLEVPNRLPVNPLVDCMDPVVMIDPVTVNDPVTSNPFSNNAYPSKNEADTALLAQLLVPNNDPVIPPSDICSDPVRAKLPDILFTYMLRHGAPAVPMSLPPASGISEAPFQ